MTKAEFEKKRKELFCSLCNQEWENKKIWEHIRDNKLSATPAFEGDLYQQSKTKIMFVGRALNGWNVEYADCATLQSTVDSILEQTGAFDTFVDDRGFGDDGRKYYHKNSRFFRFLKHILEDVGESDVGIDETWYSDSKKWNQRFVWANLYCISPKNPKPGEDANPTSKMIKPSISDYVDLMDLYIRRYQPDIVVFITDIAGWFERWKRERSFKDIMDVYQECNFDDVIVAKGNLGESKIIVCKRPDRRGTSYEKVANMAHVVANNM